MTTHGKKGLFAASALTKVMSGDMTTDMTVAIGPPAYDPERNVLYLPAIPADDVPEHVLDRLLAYLGHEAAERGRSTWLPNDPRWRNTPALKGLVNAINDARIDMEQSDAYPGFGMKMRTVRIMQAKKMVREYRAGDNKPSFGRIAMLCVFLGEGLMTFDQAVKLFPTWKKFLRRGEHILRNLDVSTEPRCIEQAIALHAALQTPTPPSNEKRTAPADSTQNEDGTVPGSVRVPTGERAMDAPPDSTVPTQDPLEGEELTDETDLDDAPTDAADEDKSETLADDTASPRHGDKPDGGDDVSGAREPDTADRDGAPEDGAAQGSERDNDGDDEHPKADASDTDAGRRDESKSADVQHGRTSRRDEGESDNGRAGPQDREDDGERLSDDGSTVDVQDGLLAAIVQEMFETKTWSKDPYGGPRATRYTFDPSRDIIEQVTGRRGAAHKELQLPAQVLETKMRQVLTAPSMKYARDREKGELDERAIGRFVAGDPRVFRRRTRQESDSVAATVSWDESSSMMGKKIAVVRDLAHTWNQALGKLNIPTELLGWATAGGMHTDRKAGVYRQGVLRHRVYKSFADRWNDERVLGALDSISTASVTPTAEGLLFAAERISRRPESRRVIFFLTDGQPGISANGHPEVHFRFIQTLLRRCEVSGIEVIGIGIGVDITKHFPVSLQVNSVTEVQNVATDELLKILRSSRRV